MFTIKIETTNRRLLTTFAAIAHENDDCSIFIEGLEDQDSRVLKMNIGRVQQAQRNHEILQKRSMILLAHRYVPQKITDALSFFKSKDCDDMDPFTRNFIISLLQNESRDPHGRRYRPHLIELAYVISVYSEPALKCLTDKAGFPSIQTVDEKFHGTIATFVRNLTNINGINEVLTLAALDSDTDRIAIAVDAINLKLHFSDGNTLNRSNAFLFFAMPLNSDKRSCVIQLFEHHSGLISHENEQSIFAILDAIPKHINVSFIAHDGDQGYDQKHRDFFNTWYGILR